MGMFRHSQHLAESRVRRGMVLNIGKVSRDFKYKTQSYIQITTYTPQYSAILRTPYTRNNFANEHNPDSNYISHQNITDGAPW